MAIKAGFSYQDIPELSPRVLQQLVREALTEAVQEWRKNMEPKHFTNQAVSEYGYQKRKKKYQIRKAKTQKTTAPLTYSGETKRQALASNKITKRGNQITLNISVPDYFTQLKAMKPDMAKELTAITEAEKNQLIQRMETLLQAKIDQKLTAR